MKRNALLALLLTAVAVPAVAQYSEGYTFLKAVRERNGAKATSIVSNPGSTAINARERGTGEAGLHIVTRGRDLGWVNFLLARGARPDIQDEAGNTPLIVAAQIGFYEAAEQLLARRANVNLSNSRGETPLIFAVQQRNIAMVGLLLANGADPSRADSVAGYSAIDYARRDNRAGPILRLLQAPQRRAPQLMGPSR